ncbi:MAG: HAMP domain-containing protein [Proteobacteria bacterium]|nr:HAMP domain-containing protein [Pseudomonadota bacterium]
MRLLPNSSIKWRLTSLITMVSFISVVLTTLAISIIGVYNIRSNIVRELEISASIVGDRNTAALIFNDDKQATNNLSVFSVNTAIVQACLYDANSKLFASYTNQRHEHDAQCPTETAQKSEISQQRIRVMLPVVKMQDTIGHIYLESTQDQIDAYIERQFGIALMVSSAVLLISYLLAINLQHEISRPILKLSDVARQVSQNRDYTLRAAPVGNPEDDKNELVILTESFNAMLTEIDARDQQLKQKNTELEKAKDVAESANRSKSQFLANISHELRTPLNAIIGFSSILMNQLFGALGDGKYLEYARDINESGVHLLDIINDILDLSKAEAGKLTLSFEEVHVAKSINKCMTILSERAQKGGVTINTSMPKTLPSLVADRLRFIQILLNIMSNSVKFTAEGGKVLVEVRTQEAGGEVSHFVITVEDTGIGMSPGDVEKAFQSFGQVDSGLNRKYEGTGLGLPLTKKLIELHHGSIQIESELGVGTRVTLVFPAVPPGGLDYVLAEAD